MAFDENQEKRENTNQKERPQATPKSHINLKNINPEQENNQGAAIVAEYTKSIVTGAAVDLLHGALQFPRQTAHLLLLHRETHLRGSVKRKTMGYNPTNDIFTIHRVWRKQLKQ